MTTREKGYIYYAECCESLARARRILQALRGIDERTAAPDAAFHFALVEYAKPYSRLEDAGKRQRHAYRLGPPSLPPEDLALHRQILTVRDQILAHSELTLSDAMAPPGRDGTPPNDAGGRQGPPSTLRIEEIIGLIERTLDIMYVERDRLLESLTASHSRRRIIATTAKIALQAIGILAGFFGLGMLCVTASVAYHLIMKGDAATVPFAFFFLGLAAYFLYVAYLVLCDYSPLAVRHICGVLALCALGSVKRLLAPSGDLRGFTETPWVDFAYLACLVALYFAYRVASDRLSRLLFSETASGVSPVRA